MNILKLFFATAAVSAIAVGCSMDEKVQIDNTAVSHNMVERQGRSYPAEAFIPGVLSVKFSSEMADQIEVQYDADGKLVSTGVPSLDQYAAQLGVTEMVRIFPYAGKFEARHRRAGLHQWYDLYFDTDITLTKATKTIEVVEGIETIEYNPTIGLYDNNNSGMKVTPLTAVEPSSSQNSTVYPFDDPELPQQWHYYNDGETPKKGIAGADINVFPVWKEGTVGNSDIIVAVVDEGVDYLHEDLAANMWTSVLNDGTEQDGIEIHGADFSLPKGEIGYEIQAGSHGTHVAGTIGAVNNNGTGVSGIAGGDFKNNKPGVKIMSCQIFYNYGNGQMRSSQNAGNAMIWAADHGAVISQNSWGYNPEGSDPIDYVPDDDKAGIDYFIQYAGYDENDNPVGPIQGGIVIFAAGNHSRAAGYPALYEKNLTVAAIMSNYEMSEFSNYGDWVDIAAPGGTWLDSRTNDWIYSTMPGDQYGWNSGTSMACPHVSGVAALVLSNIADKGGKITPEELRSSLIMGVNSIAEYNPGKDGLYGSGLIDAEKCVKGVEIDEDVKAISDLDASTASDKVSFSLTLPVSATQPNTLFLMTSSENITEENFENAAIKSFDVSELESGSAFSGHFYAGVFEKSIYMAAIVIDDNGQRTPISNVVKVTTGKNNPPVIEALDGTDLNIKILQTLTFRFVISDPDGHRVYPSLNKSLNYITYEYTGNVDGNDTLTMTFLGNLIGSDTKGEITLTVKDEHELVTEQLINYSFTKNNTPVLVANPPEINLTVGDAPYAFEFTDEYIYEMDNDPLSIRIVTDTTGNGIVNLTTEGATIFIEPVGVGTIKLELMVRDPMGKSATAFMTVNVKATDQPLKLYPNPVVDVLNIASRVGSIEGAQVTVFSEGGNAVIEQQTDILKGAPAQIDMTGYPAGSYSVSVVIGDQTHNSNFVKL